MRSQLDIKIGKKVSPPRGFEPWSLKPKASVLPMSYADPLGTYFLTNNLSQKFNS